jgi:hypothetical protein
MFLPRVVRLVLSMENNVKQSDEPFHLSQVPGVRVVSSGLDYSVTLVQVDISHKSCCAVCQLSDNTDVLATIRSKPDQGIFKAHYIYCYHVYGHDIVLQPLSNLHCDSPPNPDYAVGSSCLTTLKHWRRRKLQNPSWSLMGQTSLNWQGWVTNKS